VAIGTQLINRPDFLVWKESERNIRHSDASYLVNEATVGRHRTLRTESGNKKGAAKDDMEE
jgi:hypothetical protein